MTAREAKHQAMFSEWKDRIIECRNSGLRVSEWCQLNGYGLQTYYRWEREIMEEASKQLVPQTSAYELSTPVFAELPPPREEPIPSNQGEIVATVDFGRARLSIYTGADTAFIKALCEALTYVK